MAERKKRQTRKAKGTRQKRRSTAGRRGPAAGQTSGGALRLVRSVREKATDALRQLRREIAATQAHLEKLEAEERGFREDLTGSPGPRPHVGRRADQRRTRTRKAPQPQRKGSAKADRYFAKLPDRFALEDVRKIAGRLSGVSIAQWVRAGKVKKVGQGYRKATASRSPKRRTAPRRRTNRKRTKPA